MDYNRGCIYQCNPDTCDHNVIKYVYLWVIMVVVPDALLGVLEAFSHKVHGLELGDGVFLDAGLLRLEGAELRLVRQTVLKKERRENIRVCFSAVSDTLDDQ